MEKEEFEKLVQKAVLGLPENIREKMDNVAIVIEEESSRAGLLGLYQGVPQNAWGRGFGMRLPDKITIFQNPIERLARSEAEIVEIVRNTVWHEIAHHFGFDEKGARKLETKWRKQK